MVLFIFICNTLPVTPPPTSPPTETSAGLLRSAVRRDIVDTLANLPADQREIGLRAQELGEVVGLHVTTVRFHLTQLVDAGLLESHAVRSTGAGRPSKKYRLAAGSMDDVSSEESYRRLAQLLAESFGARHDDGTPLTPEEVGAAWAHRRGATSDPAADRQASTAGEWLAKVGLMIDVLRDWGYTPNLRTEDAGRTVEIEISSCPFLPLAKNNPEVACGVHRGLMRGTLDRLGEPDAEFSLVPFVDPNRCLAHITTRANLAPRGGTT